MLCSRSVRLNGTWQVSQEEVPTYRWAWKSRVAPEPIAADWRSGVPATTGMPAGTPSAAAGPGSSGPRMSVAAQQVRQLRLLHPGQPQQRLVVADPVRIAVVGHPVQRDRVERTPPARPVSRRFSQSFGSRNRCVARGRSPARRA